MQSFSSQGYWWLPNNPSHRLFGTVTYDPVNGTNLALVGTFADFLQTMQGTALNREDLIFGVSANGTPITLQKCVTIDVHFGFPHLPTQSFLAEFMFVGMHQTNVDSLRFCVMHIEYSKLIDWIHQSPFLQGTITDANGIEAGQGISWRTTPIAELNTEFGAIAMRRNIEPLVIGRNELRVVQEPYFDITLHQPQSMTTWLERYIYPLQNFLTLATGTPTAITGIHAFAINPSAVRYQNIEADDPVNRVDIYFRVYYTESQPITRLGRSNMLFVWEDIAAIAETVISKWLTITSVENLGSILNVYFGIQYLAHLYVETQFLTLAQSIEAYHRERSDETPLSTKVHAELVKRILDRIDSSKDRKWLESKLVSSNYLSLRVRLKRLWNLHKTIMADITVKRDIFCDRVVKTRNYLTHLDQTGKEEAASGGRLADLAQALDMMMKACLLTEVGFPHDMQVELFRKTQDYASLRDRMAAARDPGAARRPLFNVVVRDVPFAGGEPEPDPVDEMSRQSFPASDPPAWNPGLSRG